MATVARAPKAKRPRQQRPPATAVTKTADAKGRVALGKRFANRHVLIQTVSDTEIVVKLARVIPDDEVWLYQNSEALAAVQEGLEQARRGEVVQGPDLKAAAALSAQLEG
jgi:hypothetical protein